MNKLPASEDLRVFTMVARKASFAAAARELGVSAAYVTKRVRLLEADLSTQLLHRTTRRVVVTEEGERVVHWAQRVLDDLDHLVQEVSAVDHTPRGILRVSSSFGFGRRQVAPALSRFAALHRGLAVRFEVFDRLVDVVNEGFDLDVRVGDTIAPQLVARRLASNHRVLCASPAYLQRRGAPRAASDLPSHDCLVIKERDHPFGVWQLSERGQATSVKVTGPLSTNHGEVAVDWAIDGHGIVLRSWWDVGPLIRAGRLVQVLPDCRQEANVWAVVPARLGQSAKVRLCVAFLQAHFTALQDDVGA